jgi:hypothetical protein
MLRIRVPATPVTGAFLLDGLLALGACGGDGPSTPILPGPGPGPSFFALSIDGGPAGGTGPNGYDFFFGFLFPMADSVGTYTVQGDELEAHFHSNGTRYLAHPNADTTDGTVVVTRSDDRIEGTFSVTVVEYPGTALLPITGRFSVDGGYSMSCPSVRRGTSRWIPTSQERQRGGNLSKRHRSSDARSQPPSVAAASYVLWQKSRSIAAGSAARRTSS